MKGYISGYDGQALTIVVPFSNDILLQRQSITECDVYLDDGRLLSDFQREAICATCRDIGNWTGNYELERYIQTLTFCELFDYELFSLSRKESNCASVSLAREFLTYLIEQCVIHGIPCSERLLGRVEDIGRYLYACVANRRCAICGKKADVHEYDHVGAGRNRNTIHHSGQRVQPLCREHHNEVGNLGQQSFDQKYHLTWVKLDDHLCEVLGWRK